MIQHTAKKERWGRTFVFAVGLASRGETRKQDSRADLCLFSPLLLPAKKMGKHIATSTSPLLLFCLRLFDCFHTTCIVQDTVVFVAQHLLQSIGEREISTTTRRVNLDHATVFLTENVEEKGWEEKEPHLHPESC